MIVKINYDEIDLDVLDSPYTKNGGLIYSKQQIWNKVQCMASRNGLNNCFEDMHEISKLGCWCFEMTFYPLFNKSDKPQNYHYSLYICPKTKEHMQEVRKKDYTISNRHSHLFFEIPVVNSFSEEQTKKWQQWSIRTLISKLEYNNKKAQIWLRKKQLSDDFSEEAEKKDEK